MFNIKDTNKLNFFHENDPLNLVDFLERSDDIVSSEIYNWKLKLKNCLLCCIVSKLQLPENTVLEENEEKNNTFINNNFCKDNQMLTNPLLSTNNIIDLLFYIFDIDEDLLLMEDDINCFNLFLENCQVHYLMFLDCL